VTAPSTPGTATFTTQTKQAGGTLTNIATQPTVTVNGISTTTGVNSSANPSVFGQSVTFTAAVTSGSGTPTGSVDFYDGGTSCPGTSQIGTTQTLDGSGTAA